MDREVLDYNSILDDCGIGCSPAHVVVKNIANLEEFYDSAELTGIYNFFLMNVEDPEILIQVVKYSDAHRALSTLKILLEMLELRPTDESESLVALRAICAKAISNYKDTAQLLKGIDILVTIDSSIVHMAGALGVKTFLLLPYTAEWRWFNDNYSTPWYQSVRIFKQSSSSSWDEVINQVKDALSNYEC